MRVSRSSPTSPNLRKICEQSGVKLTCLTTVKTHVTMTCFQSQSLSQRSTVTSEDYEGAAVYKLPDTPPRTHSRPIGTESTKRREQDVMFLGRNLGLVIESVVPDSLHVISIRGDTVLNGILQCRDTALALRLRGSNVVHSLHAYLEVWQPRSGCLSLSIIRVTTHIEDSVSVVFQQCRVRP